jgi:hypothetical protein
MIQAVGNQAYISAIKGTEFEGMSVQMMAAMVMLDVGATKKREAENKIAEMKSQNDKAKAINNLLDRMNADMGQYVGKNEDSHKWARGEILANYVNEAKSLGLDVSNWKATNTNGVKSYVKKTDDEWRAISSSLQHQAENCNSDNQTQMVKLQDFMGQYNSFVSGASDQIKNANQILQGLAKN